MLYRELEDALDDVWYPPDMVENIRDDAEKYLVGQYKLGYLKGKGKKYVPVLIPINTLAGLKILMDKRKEFGIIKENQFLFASKSSLGHASGWLALSDLCKQAGANLPVTITATKVRHWISTVYASMDMNAQEQRIFLDHMGHDKDINKDNYQAPLSLQHVQVMGKMLHMAETGRMTLPPPVMTSFPAPIAGCSESSDLDRTMTLPPPVMTSSPPPIAGCSESSDLDSNGTMTLSPPVMTSSPALSKAGCSQSSDFGSNDANKCSRWKKEEKIVSAKWSNADTMQLRIHFKKFIFDDGLKNKGILPSKEEILHFLDSCQLPCINHLGRKDQYRKVRSKIFNERKTTRLNVEKKSELYAKTD